MWVCVHAYVHVCSPVYELGGQQSMLGFSLLATVFLRQSLWLIWSWLIRQDSWSEPHGSRLHLPGSRVTVCATKPRFYVGSQAQAFLWLSHLLALCHRFCFNKCTFFFLLIIACTVCKMCVTVSACVWIQFSPSTYTWIPGIELSSQACTWRQLLRHFTGLYLFIFHSVQYICVYM